MSRKTPTRRAPNPFGGASRGDGTQPPDAPAPTNGFTPVTKFVVPGQSREIARAYGHVLTERGWEKE